ncbi:HD domain-containing protein [Vulcanisaeta souniana]|uniref:HD domain-containing protein n=1 Tax=Vulcanisaeta souniana TaxID=164452 RepID=UPI0006CF2727|nr:HD domain-containing protein [Vulcanisaeta souniana]
MTLSYTKAIADPAFGWIRLTNEEARFIDACKYVQRLRHIHQLGLAYMVYPSAHHSRFEHSLGTLQIATLMFERIMRMSNIRELLLALGKSLGLDTEDELILHVRIAALLHDLGHLPFSHVLEGTFGQGIEPLIRNCSEDSREASRGGTVFRMPFKEHEVATYFILANNDEFRSTLKEVLPSIDLRIVKALLHADIIGKIMGVIPHYLDIIDYEDGKFLNSLINESRLFNVLRSLVSGNLDADRIEYILRDSYLTGASIGSVISIGGDIERIFDNMRIVNNNDEYTLAFDEKARANLEGGFIIARYNIYKHVYLHHKVVLFNTLARNLLGTLLRNYDILNDEFKDYLCKIYHFSTGLLRDYDIMYITDDYFLSILLRNRQYLIGKIPGVSKYLDPPLITRNTVYKALWKRDFDFIDLINKQGINLDLVNDAFPLLLSKGESRDEVLQVFYRKLREKLRNFSNKCISDLANDELESMVLIGSRTFEPETRLNIIHGNKLVNINELSPLASSVAIAWRKSPHVFIFIDITKLENNCIGINMDSTLEAIKSLVLMVMHETLLELGSIISKYFKHP